MSSVKSSREDEVPVTELLRRWQSGESEVLPRLFEAIANDLREIAGRCFSGERRDHTLQPTALVNELFLRLARRRGLHFESRSQFFTFAAVAMRSVLVDHARARLAKKREGLAEQVPLEDALVLPAPSDELLVALDSALDELARLSPRQARLVELRYFVGLSIPEIAESLEVSEITVSRDWAAAKAWLYRELARE